MSCSFSICFNDMISMFLCNSLRSSGSLVFLRPLCSRCSLSTIFWFSMTAMEGIPDTLWRRSLGYPFGSRSTRLMVFLSVVSQSFRAPLA